ncbi:hypothetical protein ACFVHQ_13450 [Actinomycetes bacterium NPDC127524]
MNVNQSDDLQKKLENLMIQKRLMAVINTESQNLNVTNPRRITLPTQKKEEKSSKAQGAVTIDPSVQSDNLGKGAHRPPKREKRFEETHKRFTNYLEIELLDMIKRLSAEGQIKNMTSILNAALYEFIHKYFPGQMKK